MTNVKTGLDVIQTEGVSVIRGDRVGLLAHAASVDRDHCHAIDVLLQAGVNLRRLFGPQHGFTGHTQDNMIEWEGGRDGRTGIELCSLYGTHRKPTPEMLDQLDTLVVDLQDVGARYYTFIWSLLGCMEACASAGVRVLVLDRPNPINGIQREGPLLDMAFRSFVGMAPIPVRHGMTIGELARFFNRYFALNCHLHVVWMNGYNRAMWFDETQLPWVLPSPNMPTLETATVYPGGCLLEATNLSEGRGTTRPFEMLGAPFVDPNALTDHLMRFELPGVRFRSTAFEPTFHKWAGQLCGGVQIHVIDRDAFRPFSCMMAILSVFLRHHAGDFAWKQPPYEYEYTLLPFDILAGSQEPREMLEARVPLEEMEAVWNRHVAGFEKDIQGDLYYE